MARSMAEGVSSDSFMAAGFKHDRPRPCYTAGMEEAAGPDNSPALHVVLVHPEIPPNTGNIARLTAGARCRLHLVEPLGFSLEDRHVRRAGLDYWPHVDKRVHPSWTAFLESETPRRDRMWFFTTEAPTSFRDGDYEAGDWLVFGQESVGLPAGIRQEFSDRSLRIPMDRTKVRSLNLANSVAVAIYEALRATGDEPG